MKELNELGQTKFEDLTSEFEGDLLAFFKILDNEINNLSFQGKTETEINKQIEGLFGE